MRIGDESDRFTPWRVTACFAGCALLSCVLAVVFIGCYTGVNFLVSLVSCW